jgi:hypothetical protein
VPADHDIDDLFTLPPDRFTAERDALAKRLAQGGDQEAATEVRALRKPTLTAWALNQLSRRHGGDIEALVEAGSEVRGAQRKALSGVRGGDFRDAMGRRRKLVQDLTHRTVEILAEVGRGPQSAEDEIGRTFEAASSDPEAAELVLKGRLTRPITTASGFDSVAGLGVIDGGQDRNSDAATKRTAAEVDLANAQRKAQKAHADANRAEMRVQNLREQAEEATRRLREAEEEAERLSSEAAHAEDRLRRARRDVPT